MSTLTQTLQVSSSILVQVPHVGPPQLQAALLSTGLHQHPDVEKLLKQGKHDMCFRKYSSLNEHNRFVLSGVQVRLVQIIPPPRPYEEEYFKLLLQTDRI